MARRLAIAFALAGVTNVAMAQTGPRMAPPEVNVVSGAYELANAEGTRKCLVLLRPASAPGGHAVGFPAPCRLALPIMASVAAWTIEPSSNPPHARIRLRNSAGAVMLDFASEGEEGSVIAKDVTDAAYVLKPNAGATLAARIGALPAVRPAEPRTAVQTTAAILSVTAPPDPAAMTRNTGTYLLHRDKGRNTGCRLVLEAQGQDGTARLAGGCADAGVMAFAPAGWRITEGTLWLVGGKGQRLSFERNRRNGWDKGPGQGAALMLVREPN